MTYDVMCTFDLKNATQKDYQTAYSLLENLGLKRVVAGAAREVVIPTTTVIGPYTGPSREDVRDAVREKIKKSFESYSLKSEIFVLAGNWTWGSTTS